MHIVAAKFTIVVYLKKIPHRRLFRKGKVLQRLFFLFVKVNCNNEYKEREQGRNEITNFKILPPWYTQRQFCFNSTISVVIQNNNYQVRFFVISVCLCLSGAVNGL